MLRRRSACSAARYARSKPFVIAHVGLIWLARALYYHPGLVPALLDFGLCGFSVIAALATAKQTGSLFLAMWTFFLVQALFIAIPTFRGDRGATTSDDDGFDRAYRAAQQALRRLSTQP